VFVLRSFEPDSVAEVFRLAAFLVRSVAAVVVAVAESALGDASLVGAHVHLAAVDPFADQLVVVDRVVRNQPPSQRLVGVDQKTSLVDLSVVESFALKVLRFDAQQRTRRDTDIVPTLPLQYRQLVVLPHRKLGHVLETLLFVAPIRTVPRPIAHHRLRNALLRRAPEVALSALAGLLVADRVLRLESHLTTIIILEDIVGVNIGRGKGRRPTPLHHFGSCGQNEPAAVHIRVVVVSGLAQRGLERRGAVERLVRVPVRYSSGLSDVVDVHHLVVVRGFVESVLVPVGTTFVLAVPSVVPGFAPWCGPATVRVLLSAVVLHPMVLPPSPVIICESTVTYRLSNRTRVVPIILIRVCFCSSQVVSIVGTIVVSILIPMVQISTFTILIPVVSTLVLIYPPTALTLSLIITPTILSIVGSFVVPMVLPPVTPDLPILICTKTFWYSSN
jgi:hypothetical protein